MELKRAKEVLEGMQNNPEPFNEEGLLISFPGTFVEVSGYWPATLMGEFNPDQLEAIATWMRDPEGVVKA